MESEIAYSEGSGERMSDFEEIGASEQGRTPAAEAHPRAVGSPLPMGSGAFATRSLPAESTQAASSVPLGRALPGASAGSQGDQPSSLQKAVNAIRMALPFVQRMLPLLDGNIATTVSNLLTPHPHGQARPQVAAPPPEPASLVHVEDSLAQLQTQQEQLRDQVSEQNTSLRRVEDQLEMVREATDRNTLEQQELMEDLKTFGNRATTFAVIASLLLVVSIFFNLVLFLHLQRVLP